jgi:hypothetical protein
MDIFSLSGDINGASQACESRYERHGRPSDQNGNSKDSDSGLDHYENPVLVGVENRLLNGTIISLE